MSSWVEIANDALRRVGDDRIQSLEENSEAARSIRDVYGIARDEVLSAHPWNCAMVRTVLAADAAAPAWGYSYQYSLPTDPYCLRVYKLERADLPFEVGANRKLLTNAAGPLKLLYIARVTDPQLFPFFVASVISACIAWKIAFRLTQSRSAEQALGDAYRAELRASRSIDGQEGTVPDPEANEDSFLGARL